MQCHNCTTIVYTSWLQQCVSSSPSVTHPAIDYSPSHHTCITFQLTMVPCHWFHWSAEQVWRWSSGTENREKWQVRRIFKQGYHRSRMCASRHWTSLVVIKWNWEVVLRLRTERSGRWEDYLNRDTIDQGCVDIGADVWVCCEHAHNGPSVTIPAVQMEWATHLFHHSEWPINISILILLFESVDEESMSTVKGMYMSWANNPPNPKIKDPMLRNSKWVIFVDLIKSSYFICLGAGVSRLQGKVKFQGEYLTLHWYAAYTM